MMEQPRSVYRSGAEDGLILGPVMALAIISMGASTALPWLIIPALCLFVAVPSLMYVFLLRGYRQDYGTSTFSAMWMHGIATFFFGGLLMGLAVYVCLHWIWPDFICRQVQTTIDILKDTPGPDAAQMAQMFETAMKTGQMPGAMAVVLELIFMAVFSGSILSMILSLVIRNVHKGATPPAAPNQYN